MTTEEHISASFCPYGYVLSNEIYEEVMNGTSVVKLYINIYKHIQVFFSHFLFSGD